MTQNIVHLGVVAELHDVEENREDEAERVQIQVKASVEMVWCTFGYDICDGEGDS